MNREQVEAVAQAGSRAALEAGQTPLLYFVRSALGGGFLFIGVFLSIMTTSLLQGYHDGIARVAGAFVFPVGLALIVLLGAQLYTGAAFTLPMAVFERKIKISDATKTILICFAGNIVGLAVMSALLVASGAQQEPVAVFLQSLVPARLAVHWGQTFLRAVICNFYIAVAVYAGTRLKTEGAQLVCMFFVIAGFVLSGTDHSIANAAYFLLYGMLNPGADLLPMVGNVLVAAVGNLVGGAVLSALPFWLLGRGAAQPVAAKKKNIKFCAGLDKQFDL